MLNFDHELELSGLKLPWRYNCHEREKLTYLKELGIAAGDGRFPACRCYL